MLRTKQIRQVFFLLAAILSCLRTTHAAEEAERVKQAGIVLNEIFTSPQAIPDDILNKAKCAIIFPAVWKGAFGVHNGYGRGVMLCREGPSFSGSWSAPAFYALEGVDVSMPLSGRSTDFLLLIMYEEGARSILSGKVKLGSDMTTFAGPLNGASNSGSAVLAYARDKGKLTGISLHGCTLRSDTNADQKLYGKKLNAKEIVTEAKADIPPSAQQLIEVLDRKLSGSR